MYQSLAAGRRVTLDRVGIFADGVAVREVGELTFPIVAGDGRRDRPRVERRDLRGDQGHLRRHAIDDGAGRSARRGRACGPGSSGRARRARGSSAVLSGANMNFDRLRFVAERAEVGEAREALFGVTIPERPWRVSRVLRDHRPTRRDRVQLPPERPRPRPHLRWHRHQVARGRCGARRDAQRSRLRDRRADRQRGRQASRPAHGRRPERRTCGTSSCADSSSPNGPARSSTFLETLGGRWNISLFHYRNHGADFGRVLAGFEVPPGRDGRIRERSSTRSAISISGKSSNQAYKMFLT